MWCVPFVIAARRRRGDEHRKDGRVVARKMEVLKVERVIPSLVVVSHAVLVLAALELDRKDRRSRNEGRVNSAPVAALRHALVDT